MKTGWLAVLVSSLGLIATRAAAQPNLTGPIKIAIVGPRLKPGLRATFSWFVPLPKAPLMNKCINFCPASRYDDRA